MFGEGLGATSSSNIPATGFQSLFWAYVGGRVSSPCWEGGEGSVQHSFRSFTENGKLVENETFNSHVRTITKFLKYFRPKSIPFNTQ